MLLVHDQRELDALLKKKPKKGGSKSPAGTLYAQAEIDLDPIEMPGVKGGAKPKPYFEDIAVTKPEDFLKPTHYNERKFQTMLREYSRQKPSDTRLSEREGLEIPKSFGEQMGDPLGLGIGVTKGTIGGIYGLASSIAYPILPAPGVWDSEKSVLENYSQQWKQSVYKGREGDDTGAFLIREGAVGRTGVSNAAVDVFHTIWEIGEGLGHIGWEGMELLTGEGREDAGNFIANFMHYHYTQQPLARAITALIHGDRKEATHVLNTYRDLFEGKSDKVETGFMADFVRRDTANVMHSIGGSLDDDWTETEIREMVTKLQAAYNDAKLSDHDTTFQHAIAESMFDVYTDFDTFMQEVTQRPAGVLLDLIDIYELTKAPQLIGRMGKGMKKMPAKMQQVMKRWKELQVDNVTKKRALQTKIDRGIADGTIDATPYQKLEQIGKQIKDRTGAEVKRGVEDIKYLLDPPDDFGGAAPAGGSLSDLLGIADEAPKPDFIGSQNLIPDADTRPSNIAGLNVPDTTRGGGGARRIENTLEQTDLSEHSHDTLSQMRDDAQSLGDTDEVALIDAELQRRGQEQGSPQAAREQIIGNLADELENDGRPIDHERIQTTVTAVMRANRWLRHHILSRDGMIGILEFTQDNSHDIELVIASIEETAEDLGRPIERNEIAEIIAVHENSRNMFERYNNNEVSESDFDTHFNEYRELLNRLEATGGRDPIFSPEGERLRGGDGRIEPPATEQIADTLQGSQTDDFDRIDDDPDRIDDDFDRIDDDPDAYESTLQTQAPRSPDSFFDDLLASPEEARTAAVVGDEATDIQTLELDVQNAIDNLNETDTDVTSFQEDEAFRAAVEAVARRASPIIEEQIGVTYENLPYQIQSEFENAFSNALEDLETVNHANILEPIVDRILDENMDAIVTVRNGQRMTFRESLELPEHRDGRAARQGNDMARRSAEADPPTDTSQDNFLENVNPNMLNDANARQRLAASSGFLDSLADMVSQDIAEFYIDTDLDRTVDAASVRQRLAENDFELLREMWENVEDTIYASGDLTPTHFRDGLTNGFREVITEDSILSGEFQSRPLGSAGTVDMGEGTNRPSSIYRDDQGNRMPAPADETTQTGGMEFLARQDPQGLDFASLTPQQFEELLTIAERDNNTALLDRIEAEATRRLEQSERNDGRRRSGIEGIDNMIEGRERIDARWNALGEAHPDVPDEIRDWLRSEYSANPARFNPLTAAVEIQERFPQSRGQDYEVAILEFLHDLLNENPLTGRSNRPRSSADTIDRLGSELEEVYQRQDMANTRRINSQGRDTATAEEYQSTTQEIERLENEIRQAREQLQSEPRARPNTGQEATLETRVRQWRSQREREEIGLLSTQIEEWGREGITGDELETRVRDWRRLQERENISALSRQQERWADENRSDVLIGDGGQRSSPGFDTQRGIRAAREGAQATNAFDNTETYPTPDNIVEKMDEIYSELDSIQPEQMGASSRHQTEALSPAQINQRDKLLAQLEQAQQALRRRIPGRGTRLNMGIDPTQLGEAARGLWDNLKDALKKLDLPKAAIRAVRFVDDARTRGALDNEATFYLHYKLGLEMSDAAYTAIQSKIVDIADDAQLNVQDLKTQLADELPKDYTDISIIQRMTKHITPEMVSRVEDALNIPKEAAEDLLASIHEQVRSKWDLDTDDLEQSIEAYKTRVTKELSEILHSEDVPSIVEMAASVVEETIAQIKVDFKAAAEGKGNLATAGMKGVVNAVTRVLDKSLKTIGQRIADEQNPFGYNAPPKKPKGPASAAIRSIPGHFAETASLRETTKRVVDTWRKTNKELNETRDVLSAEKRRPQRTTIGKRVKALVSLGHWKTPTKHLYDLTAAWGESTVDIIREVLQASGETQTAGRTKALYDKLHDAIGPSNASKLLGQIESLRFHVAAEGELDKALALLTDATGTPIGLAEETMALPQTLVEIEKIIGKLERGQHGNTSGRTDVRPASRIRGRLNTFMSDIQRHRSTRFEEQTQHSLALTLTRILSDDLIKNHPVFKAFDEIYNTRGQNTDTRSYAWLFGTLDQYINEFDALAGRDRLADLQRRRAKRPTDQQFQDFARIVRDTEAYKDYKVFETEMKGLITLQDFMQFWRDIYGEFTDTSTSSSVEHRDIKDFTKALLADFDNFTTIMEGTGNVHRQFRDLNKYLKEMHSHLNEDFVSNFSKAVDALAGKEQSSTASPLVDFIFAAEPTLLRNLWETLFEPQRQRGKSRVTPKKGKMSQQEIQSALRSKNVADWPPEMQLAVVRGYMLKSVLERLEPRTRSTIDRGGLTAASDATHGRNPYQLKQWLEQNIGDEKGVILFGPEIWGALKQMKLSSHTSKWLDEIISGHKSLAILKPLKWLLVDNPRNVQIGEFPWRRELANNKNIPEATILAVIRAAGIRLLNTSPVTRQAARKTERAKDAQPTKPIFNLEPTLDFLEMR